MVGPALKSEDPPASNDGPVKVIVASTFQELVLDGQDVLVFIHAPWCEHCKRLMAVVDELGDKFSASSSMVIAKMDGSANEMDGLSFSSYPTIRLWPAFDKQSPVDFKGDRTAANFVTFLSKHASVQFDVSRLVGAVGAAAGGGAGSSAKPVAGAAHDEL